MEHLPIHVADEVLLGGPVHYRWMYPFERFIYHLKQLGQKGNRAEVEASIVNAYIQLETSYLGSDYLDSELTTTTGVWELGETLPLPQWIHYLSSGFQSDIACSATYKVNNYKFHIESHGEGRNTVNSHVYVKGIEGTHYYDVIEEIIHMRCRTNHRLKVVLFKCRWYDPHFVRSHPSNGVVIVNTHRPYPQYDPYFLAQQAVQVYYVTFPGLAGQNNQGWVSICTVKPTNAINMDVANVPFQDEGENGTEMPVLDNVSGALGNLADEEVYEYDTEDDGNDDHEVENPDIEDYSSESL
ncbi:hypothetical protein QQ045_002224 [Rhodiola kirilowii]